MSITRLLLSGYARRLKRLRSQPREEQDTIARWISQRYEQTPLGRELGLSQVRNAQQFRETVPLIPYSRMQENFERPLYWGLTSGSTGESKKIPVTRELLKGHSSNMTLTLSSFMLEQNSLRALRGHIFFLSSMDPIDSGVEDDGVPRGWSTSIGVQERPKRFQKKVFPANELDDIEDWTEKLDRLVAIAQTKDTRVILGMPPWLLAFAEHAKKKLGISSLTEIWPNMQLMGSSGTSLGPYRERIRESFGDIHLRDVYSATESTMAFQDTSEPGLLPAADTVLLEFIPEDEIDLDEPARISLADLEVGKRYELVCSTVSGLLGYRMGDMIKVVSDAPIRFIIVGRASLRIDVAGERMTQFEVERAMNLILRDDGRFDIREYCVAGVGAQEADALPYHQWYVVGSSEIDCPQLATALDELLQRDCKQYLVSREGSSPVLGAPRVQLVSEPIFQAWLEKEGRVGGAKKVPRVLRSIPSEFTATSETKSAQGTP